MPYHTLVEATLLWLRLEPGDVLEIALGEGENTGFQYRFVGIMQHLPDGALCATGWYPSIRAIQPNPLLVLSWSPEHNKPTIDGNVLSERIFLALVRHTQARPDLVAAMVNGPLRLEHRTHGEELH